MRTIIACLAMAACAATPTATPAERLAGCWLAPPPAAALMRWAPDSARPGVMLGVRNDPRGGEPTRFRLALGERGVELCELVSDGADPQCWAVAEGEGGSLEGGRAFIDRHGDRLTIEILGGGPSRLVFQGHQRRCG
ncbi:MAG: hypothetical protein ABL883_13155 [Terricaulis sp.]